MFSFLFPSQTWNRLHSHENHHAVCVGEDLFELAGIGAVPLDPGGSANPDRPRLQLNTQEIQKVSLYLSNAPFTKPYTKSII